ncbi:alpha/beta fold hydrolase [Nocardia yamanashiensis]|uniref:alpha/beta fold hydrolase n=1 Tax=Nocardia yamanashiensis TaxID=209247 RepID=UPI000835B0BA|nr:alpha/beta fold hydrolase [Nocardia yamanashiensis]
MTTWNRIDRGAGRPLVLLHGGGSSARSWLPVIDLLAARRRVIALDLPGFGDTPALNGGPFTMARLMDELAAELDRLGIATPVDMAGNSMGGWLALEAATRGLASSVVGIGPAGLWNPAMPIRTRLQFFAGIAGAWTVRTPARALLRYPVVRTLALSAPLHHPERLSTGEAIGIVEDLYRSLPTLRRALRIAFHSRFEGGRHLSIPITLAFGSHDRMVRPRDSRFLDQLPPHTRTITLLDCGHMPMWEDPELIARTILHGIETPSNAGELGA